MNNFHNGEIIVNNHIIKIVGLLGDYSTKQRLVFQKQLLNDGYQEDDASPLMKKILKDIFYKDFREIMFEKKDNIEENKLLSRRFRLNINDHLSFVKKNGNQPQTFFETNIQSVEVFFFGEEIAMFSICLQANHENCNINYLNDLLFLVKQFDVEIIENKDSSELKSTWHEYISKNYLAGTALRSDKGNIKVDHYSGSKFKTFCVVDGDIPPSEHDALLFDLGTSSPINSGKGEGSLAPTQDYYNVIMQNKISVFKNWESLCLFDSFTTVGTGFLAKEYQVNTWKDTYFRIYLFRLFFKYNLFRYNTDLHENTIKLRDQFEQFLNDYNINLISFNFLPNEMYKKMGEALNLQDELMTFQERISRISAAIQEEKQSKMNMLLQAVAAISALSSVSPIIEGVTMVQEKLGWGNSLFYSILTILLLSVSSGVLFFLFPDQCKMYFKKIFRSKRKQ